ncbi:LAGLIDADG-2 domain-containing protein [Fusobacterium necrophorum subsp. funduliforme]|uniref:LAGLIDADG family homing endonuclease n=1 Tax=Fusobacterium necrophorum TaxID=859 RepID=UPI00370F53E1
MNEEIKEMYLLKKTKKEIMQKFNIKSYSELNNILSEMNLLKKTNSNRYKVNDDIFNKIDTEEKAYLLGFLSADGYILKDGKTIGIALKSEDKYMLEKFKEILQYEGKIYDYKCTTSYGYTEYSRLKFTSIKIYNFLKNFGFTNKKSYFFEPKIETIEKNVYKDFLRGYFDGNCCITIRYDHKNIKRFSVHILGLKNIIELFTKHFDITKEYPFLQRKENCKTLDIKFQKINLVDRVLDGLYKNSNIYLKRKYKRYIEFKNTTYKKVVHI